MKKRLPSYLSQRYTDLKAIEDESIRILGEEDAFHFVELANDWIEISDAIRRTYPQDYITQSLVSTYFFYLFKEVQWFQLHFLCGNYPLLGRGLRFVWELIYRAYYTDVYEADSPPGPSLEDKFLWLKEHEAQLHWGNCIGETLGKVLPIVRKHEEVYEHYHKLWQDLNLYVHPSADLISRMMGESALLVADHFDEAWARESIRISTEVFDVVWLAILSRFPQCVPLLKERGQSLACPLTRLVLEKSVMND